MARVFAPIVDCLPIKAKRNWSNCLLDVLEEYTVSDDYTYTMRLSIDEEEWPTLKEKLLAKSKEAGQDITDLVSFIEENNCDVSFLVDLF